MLEESTSDNFLNGSAVYEHNLIFGSKEDLKISSSTNDAKLRALITGDNKFDKTKFGASLFKNAYGYGVDFTSTASRPDFTLVGDSEAASGALFTHAKVADNFFEKVSYKGAFGAEDWTAGWAHFDPQNLPYTKAGEVK